jgi:hypothetical protein
MGVCNVLLPRRTKQVHHGFQTQEDFAKLPLTETPDRLTKMPWDEEVDCVLGTVDLSVQ